MPNNPYWQNNNPPPPPPPPPTRPVTDAPRVTVRKSRVGQGVAKKKTKKQVSEEDLFDNYEKETEPKEKKSKKGKASKAIHFDFTGGYIGEDYINSKISGVKQAFYGQTDYTADIKQVLSRYGNQTVVGMKIVRSPVNSAIVGALNTASMGNFQNNMNKQNIDTLYHLKLEIRLSSGATVTTEKEEILRLRVGVVYQKDQEEKQISNVPAGITLQQLMDNTKQHMGSSAFFSYNAKQNNCQNYILNLLIANEIGSSDDYAYVKQQTAVLFNGLKNTQKLSNTLTNIGAKIALISEGGNVY